MKAVKIGVAALLASVLALGGAAYAELNEENISLCQYGTGADINKAIKAKKLNVNDKTPDGYTPIMYAAYNPDESAMTTLLKAKAQPNAADANGRTALMHAIENPTPNVKVIAALLHAQAKTNVKDKEGITPLMLACQYAQDTQIVDMLLKNKAPYDVADKNGYSPLIYAAYNTNADIVNALIAKGARDTRKDSQGRNALFHAAANNTNPDVIYALLNSGTDTSVVDKKGRTPLLAAAATNPSWDVIYYLYEAGYDPFVVDKEGNTGLHLAAAYQTNATVFLNIYLFPNDDGSYAFNHSAKNKAGKTPAQLLKENPDLANDATIQQVFHDEGMQNIHDTIGLFNTIRGIIGK